MDDQSSKRARTPALSRLCKRDKRELPFPSPLRRGDQGVCESFFSPSFPVRHSRENGNPVPPIPLTGTQPKDGSGDGVPMRRMGLVCNSFPSPSFLRRQESISPLSRGANGTWRFLGDRVYDLNSRLSQERNRKPFLTRQGQSPCQVLNIVLFCQDQRPQIPART